MTSYQEIGRMYNENLANNIMGDNRFECVLDEVSDIQIKIQLNYDFLEEFDMELNTGTLFRSNEIELVTFGRFRVDGFLVGDYVQSENFFDKNAEMISTNPSKDYLMNEEYEGGFNNYAPVNNVYTEEKEEELMKKIRINLIVNEQLTDDINIICDGFMKEFKEKLWS